MGPPELIIVGIIAIAVIFGAKKLPEIAHNLGRSSNEFKKGLKEGAEEADAPAAQPTPAHAGRTPARSAHAGRDANGDHRTAQARGLGPGCTRVRHVDRLGAILGPYLPRDPAQHAVHERA